MKKALFIFLLNILPMSCDSNDDSSNIENNCDFISEIISEDNFNTVNTSNYIITNVELNNDCLKIPSLARASRS